MRSPALAVLGERWEMTAPGALTRVSEVEFEAGPGEAIVRVAGCGVCHTDLGFLYDGVRARHALPLALGHEISGEVVAAAPEFAALVGRAVIVPAVTPCGRCADCANGRAPVCTRQVMPGNDIQGGFASHVVVPARGLCPVDVEGALTGAKLGRSGCDLARLSVVADAVTTPYQAVVRSHLVDGDLAIVVGLGGVGGFAAQIARAFGATVIGFDLSPARLELLGRHGVELALDPSTLDTKSIRKAVRAFASERGLSTSGWKIFECSGSAPGQELAWSLLGPRAFLSVVGFTLDAPQLRLSNLMAFDATAQGNWGCLPEHYPAALQLVLDGRVALDPFVEVHPLAEIERVLDDVHHHRLDRRAVLVP